MHRALRPFATLATSPKRKAELEGMDLARMNTGIEQARANLPLPRLMIQQGDEVPLDAKGSIKCPFCKKDSATLKQVGSRWWFKCFSTSCRSGTSEPKGAWDEVGYLMHKIGLKRNDAFKVYLKEAGVWQEERLAASIMPGQKRRKRQPAAEVDFVEEGNGKNEKDGTDGRNAQEPEGQLSAGADGGKAPPPPHDEMEPEPDPEPEPERKRSLLALREFYGRLMLTAEDEKAIQQKRGLPPEAIRAFGRRSSLRSNQGIIEEMIRKHGEEAAAEAGMCRIKDGRARPEPQLCGWGNTGRKDERGELVWGWVHPVLIPYLDSEGEVIAIRPHKGGSAGQPPRLFVARYLKPPVADGQSPTLPVKKTPAHCVVTEGEFKAMALFWVFQGDVAAAALPGISQAKNYRVMEELRAWLLYCCRPEKIVVAFDNEEKGDPRLPGFKADERKRYDAEIWASYLAIVLQRTFGAGAVARLPDGWRDKNGKADWDGHLAVHANAASPQEEAASRQTIRAEFSAVLMRAVPANEFRQG